MRSSVSHVLVSDVIVTKPLCIKSYVEDFSQSLISNTLDDLEIVADKF